MRVLLVGEYSGVHSNLRELLLERGHEVIFIHDGDSYKKFQNSDLSVEYKRINLNHYLMNKFISFYILILDILGIKGLIQCLKYIKILEALKEFDIVQLINTKPFGQFGTFANYLLLKKIFKLNNNCYLCALGDDYTWVKSCLKKNPPYSMFDNLKIINIRCFIYSLNYVYGIGASFIDNFVKKNVISTIPGLYDYYFAYKSMNESCTEIIPIPIKINENVVNVKVEYPIKIFHGWQEGKELRKGNFLFDEAIKKLMLKYPDKLEYKVVKGVPYSEYIKLFDECHIFIDQCYSLDRGVNALLGMASGKVVLSGCDEMTVNYYKNNLDKSIINSEPDIDKIYADLEELILNLEKIKIMMRNSKNYIKNYHNYDRVYNCYLKIWE